MNICEVNYLPLYKLVHSVCFLMLYTVCDVTGALILYKVLPSPTMHFAMFWLYLTKKNL